MRRRELVLIGIIILLVGVIAGLGLGALSDDETTGAGSDVATSADTNPSEQEAESCLLYTSPSPRDKRQSRMPSSA